MPIGRIGPSFGSGSIGCARQVCIFARAFDAATRRKGPRLNVAKYTARNVSVERARSKFLLLSRFPPVCKMSKNRLHLVRLILSQICRFKHLLSRSRPRLTDSLAYSIRLSSFPIYLLGPSKGNRPFLAENVFSLRSNFAELDNWRVAADSKPVENEQSSGTVVLYRVVCMYIFYYYYLHVNVYYAL